VTAVSRRGFLTGGAAAGAGLAAGGLAWGPWGGDAQAGDGLVEWTGRHQAGITSARTPYAIAAALDVLEGTDLPLLLRDLTGRIAELTQGWPDRLDPAGNAALPPSDTGELGLERRDDGRLTMTLAFGASLFDGRFGLRDARPPALSEMPSFPGDNLDPAGCHGDLLLLVQADHLLICHHAVRDVLRRTKGRLTGRWAQPAFQRLTGDGPPAPGIADARGLLGFADGSQNLGPETSSGLVFCGAEAPGWARGGTYLAVRKIRLKLERWDRLSLTAQERSIGRQKLTGAPIGGRDESETPTLDARTAPDAHIRLANPRGPSDERRRFLRRPFSYTGGFDEYGLLDSGSLFVAFCRDLEAQFATVKRRTRGQDLDEYMVAVGGGYFFCPPGARGAPPEDYLGRVLVKGV